MLRTRLQSRLKSRKQKGFTLIELIVVIVILGILAVTAAPKFINFTDDATKAAFSGVNGGMASAMTIIYSKAAVSDTIASATQTISGANVVFGYPDASLTGIVKAAEVSNGLFSTDKSTDYTYFIDTAATPDELYFTPSNKLGTLGAAAATKAEITATNCYISYTAAADKDTAAILNHIQTGC